ncbi:MBL fold metallo-hydrolase [Bacillus sp. FJAT-45037]|uniref:MBL fold metallo-hydrolase n=1 Tax=Bacillus sp. FJAT-45037 TaxID=2011007 RepID=UPI000C24275B|nr:MBL fold metallo-hydrolase [Bacillus sp. FJAT-45037]
MLKTTVQFFGGLDTIGGNIVEITYGNSRVISDFGLTYNPQANLLTHITNSRAAKIISDSLRLGLIPAIPGFYNKEDLLCAGPALKDLPAREETNLETIVCISHLHLDHMGAMGLIPVQTPVYLSEKGLQLYRELEVIGESVIGPERELSSIAENETIKVGEITITAIPVDHDCYGSSSFLVKTPDATIVISGDIRKHGQDPEKNERWIEKVQKENPDLLLMEGTTVKDSESASPENVVTEGYISTLMNDELKGKDSQLAIFNIYHRNLDRLQNMILAGEKSSRKTVFEVETAYLISKLIDFDKTIYAYMPESLLAKQQENSLPPWQTELLERVQAVTAEDMIKEPGKYLVQNSFHNILELYELPLEGATYFHANGVPLGPFDPLYDQLLTFLADQGVSFNNINVSGHAYPDDLRYYIDQVKPKNLIPWHSLAPKYVLPSNEDAINVLLPQYGVRYEVVNGTLISIK